MKNDIAPEKKKDGITGDPAKIAADDLNKTAAKKEGAPAADQENRKPDEELSTDSLKDATGGENPFAGTPRVPVSPIDDDLRKNG